MVSLVPIGFFHGVDVLIQKDIVIFVFGMVLAHFYWNRDAIVSRVVFADSVVNNVYFDLNVFLVMKLRFVW